MRSTVLFLTLLGLLNAAQAQSGSSELPPIRTPNPPLDAKAVEALNRRIEITTGGQQLGELYDDLASEYGRSGLWKKAAELFVRAAEAHPEQSRYWMRAGVALLLADDRKAYEKWVQKMIEQFEGEKEDYCAVERVAKMCVLSTKLIGKREYVEALADQSVRDSDENPWHQYFPSTQAIVRYRLGKYPGAMAAAYHSNLINEKANSKDVTAINNAVLALCHIKRGDRAEARALLSQANRAMNEAFSDPDLVRIPGFWHDWMIAKLLYEEAVALLGEDSRTTRAR